MPKKKKHRSPQPEPPQQKDDPATARELILLATAITQLLVAILTLVIVALKGK